MKTWKQYILFICILFISTCALSAQSVTKISQRCPAPNGSTFGIVQVVSIGDIVYNPCTGRSSIFTGIADFSAATVILPGGGSPVSGTGTTNFIPRWTNGAAGVLGNTPFSWNATLYTFNNTTLNSAVTMTFTPSVTGSFNVGDFTTTPTTYFSQDYSTQATRLISSGQIRLGNETQTTALIVDSTTNTITGVGTSGVVLDSATAFTNIGDTNAAANSTTLRLDDSIETIRGKADALIELDSGPGLFTAGDATSGANGTLITLDDTAESVLIDAALSIVLGSGEVDIGSGSDTRLRVLSTSNTFAFQQSADAGIFDLSQVLNYQFFRTITPVATVGAQTINKPNGTVNFAAAATAIVVTNAVALTTSTIIVTQQDTDATCVNFHVDAKANGSFTIRTTAACTAETPVAFWVFN